MSDNASRPAPASLEFGIRVLTWKLQSIEEALSRAEILAVATQTGPGGYEVLAKDAGRLRECISVLEREQDARDSGIQPG